MNNRNNFIRTNKVGLVLCATVLGTLTGCVGYVDGPRAGYYSEPSVVVVEDDYVYYPSYQVYYSSSRHQYAYREGRNWVSRPAPRGVSINRLQASPSVRMDFHDSPAQHHAAVAKQYPKNWAPPRAPQGQDNNRRDDQRDQRGNNHER